MKRLTLLISTIITFYLGMPAVHAAPEEIYTLQEALKQAEGTNPQIKRQAEAVEQAHKRVNVALSEFLPHVDYHYQRGRARVRTDAEPWRQLSDQTKELRVEQSLFAGGSHIAGYQRAELLASASEFFYTSSEQNILAQTAAAYIQLYSAHQIIQSAEQNLTSLNSQLDITNARYEVQDVTLTDLAQAKARLALAEAERSSASEQLKQAIATFKRLVGIDPPAQLEKPEILYPLPQTLEELNARLQEGNPRIQQAQLQHRAAKKGVGVVRGELLPQASLVGSSRRSNDERFLTGRDRFDDDSILVNVRIPLFQGGGTWARFREAQHFAKEAKYAAQDIQREITEEAARSWESYKAAEEIKRANALAVEAADETLKGMREEYDNGQRTLTDVLDAERELFRSHVGLARAEEQRLVSAYQLLALLDAIKPSKK